MGDEFEDGPEEEEEACAGQDIALGIFEELLGEVEDLVGGTLRGELAGKLLLHFLLQSEALCDAKSDGDEGEDGEEGVESQRGGIEGAFRPHEGDACGGKGFEEALRP